MTDVYLKAAKRVFDNDEHFTCVAVGNELERQGMPRFSEIRQAYTRTFQGDGMYASDWWDSTEPSKEPRVFALLLMHVAQGDL